MYGDVTGIPFLLIHISIFLFISTITLRSRDYSSFVIHSDWTHTSMVRVLDRWPCSFPSFTLLLYTIFHTPQFDYLGQ